MLIQTVLSDIEITNSYISNITHSPDNSGNYLLSIEGTSYLTLNNVTFDVIDNEILYMTESTLTANLLSIKNA